MNEAVSSMQHSDLEQQVAALQRQFFLLLMALIVVSATVVFYFYYQARITSHDLDQSRPQDVQIIQLYNRNALTIKSFDKQIINYGATHPSFQPILRKYGWTPATTAPTQ